MDLSRFARRPLVVAALLLTWSLSATRAQETLFYCPMHPDVTASAPGQCVRCAMAMAAGDPYDLREYRLELQATPRAPQVGKPTRLRFTVRHPSTNAVVDKFAVVHEKPYHLFVLSQDLEHYDHIHPEPQPDGSFLLDVTFPKPGYYRLFSDFLPVGAAPQVIARVVATAGFSEGLTKSQARLFPDLSTKRTVDGMTVTLALPPSGLAAGREETLRYHVEDAARGGGVSNLEPYLGAFGHTLVMSADTLHYVHAHPVELMPEAAAGQPTSVGGPDLTFKAVLPRPGLYRVWTQLKRNDRVSTVQFTVNVASSAK